MGILQRYYNRRLGDWDVMQSCRAASDECKEWVELCGHYEPQDWKEKHQAWTYEPLLENNDE